MMTARSKRLDGRRRRPVSSYGGGPRPVPGRLGPGAHPPRRVPSAGGQSVRRRPKPSCRRPGEALLHRIGGVGALRRDTAVITIEGPRPWPWWSAPPPAHGVNSGSRTTLLQSLVSVPDVGSAASRRPSPWAPGETTVMPSPYGAPPGQGRAVNLAGSRPSRRWPHSRSSSDPTAGRRRRRSSSMRSAWGVAVNVGDPRSSRRTCRMDTITRSGRDAAPLLSTSTMAPDVPQVPRDSDLHRQRQAHDVPSGIPTPCCVGARGCSWSCTGFGIRVGGGLRGDPRLRDRMNATWIGHRHHARHHHRRRCFMSGRASTLRSRRRGLRSGDRAHRPSAPSCSWPCSGCWFALWRRRRGFRTGPHSGRR